MWVSAVFGAAWVVRRLFSGQDHAVVKPRCVVVFSGKRKSGKDYITEILQQRLGKIAAIVRLSGPLKEQYAKANNLDYNQLLSADAYKEKYRLDMIRWGEAKRDADPGVFCRWATEDVAKNTDVLVWIVSDARRPTDVQYFKERFNTVLVRVEASEESRRKRGYEFTAGIDDAVSECGLDTYNTWDVVIPNEGTEGLTATTEQELSRLVSRVQGMCTAL